jgi:hypothetical protein
MKKNKVLWSMFGLSAAVHGLVMLGVSGDGFRMPPPPGKIKLFQRSA